SNVYFSAANSSINGLYFSSVGDVHFDAYTIGCMEVTTFPEGKVEVCFWARIAPKPS
ncbi:hypothetical protein CY34DRAFT_58809, partial [Suillus luteus UH-Slu-Lm8-n1]